MANSERNTQIADDIARGVSRLMIEMGYSPLLEYTLGSGRRADVAAVNRKGKFIIVEIKSSVADFRADNKWQTYVDYCDSFYFAVQEAFPRDILPEDAGLMLADRYGASILRDADVNNVAGSRRRAETVRFARTAALRLHQKNFPDITRSGTLIDIE